MLFQPHHADYYDDRLSRACEHAITQKVSQWIENGKTVFFVLEDGTKGHLAIKKKMHTAEKEGSCLIAEIDLAAEQKKAEEGDRTAAYQLYIRSLIYTLLQKHNKDKSPTRIWTHTEQMPKIQMIGDNSFRELDPRAQSVEQSIKRLRQIIAFGVTRDLALAGQIVYELQKNPNSAFILIRGTEHLGITTGIETMARLAYPQIAGVFGDVDQDRETTCLLDLTALASRPITWSRVFWETIFDRSPNLLKLPNIFYPGMDMQNTAGLVRKLLSEDPWMPFITRTLTDISKVDPADLCIGHGTLSQRIFSA